MVEVTTALNARQLEVLRWIEAGCPDGVMQGFTYKTTAAALQGRRLVKVSKRHGLWSADITEAGRFYLQHGHHPARAGSDRTADGRKRQTRSASARRKRPTVPERAAEEPDGQVPGEAPLQASHAEPDAAGTGHASPTSSATGAIAKRRRGPVDQLIADLEAAGGVVRVPRSRPVAGTVPGVDYEHLVRSAQQYGKVPAGKRITTKALSWPDMEIRLEEGIPGTDVPRTPVPVPQRVARYHPVVVQFRDRSKRHEVSKEHLPRMLRILQGLVVEAERRGHTVTIPAESVDTYRREQWTGSRDGHIAIAVNGYPQRLRVMEVGMPSRAQWERTHYLSRESYSAVTATSKLRIEVAGYGGREGRVYRWTDGSKAGLEERLPDVLAEVEIRAAEDAHRDHEIRRRELQAQREREQAIEQATAALIESNRARHLKDEISRWELATRGRAYLTAMRATIAQQAAAIAQGDGDETSVEASTEWLTWAERYLRDMDPLNGALAMPPPPRATPDALKPFLPSRWSLWS